MAILFKNAIDNKQVQNTIKADNKHKALTAKAEDLRKQLLAIKDDCQDICDTYKYLVENRLVDRRYNDFRRDMVYGGYDNLKFDAIKDNIQGLDYMAYIDYQHLIYSFDGGFYLWTCRKFNGAKVLMPLEDAQFSLEGDYYITQCVEIMQKYLNEFAPLKDKFIGMVKKLTA